MKTADLLSDPTNISGSFHCPGAAFADKGAFTSMAFLVRKVKKNGTKKKKENLKNTWYYPNDYNLLQYAMNFQAFLRRRKHRENVDKKKTKKQ
jgi:hypothetical protein